MALTESGRMVRIEGQRLGGVGVERFITERGFVKAADGDPIAARLQDKIAIYEGIELVEQASRNHASALQKQFGGQRVTYVPFDPDKASETADVAIPDGSSVVALDVVKGISTGCVKVRYDSDATRRWDLL